MRFPIRKTAGNPLTGLRGIDAFEAFMKFLAPVERVPAGAAAVRGEAVFASVGCAACHVPVLMTGRNANPVFDRRPVPLYSDLLLHDVATGDGIAQGAAQPNEIRTPAPLGAAFSAGRCCTTETRRRRKQRCSGTATKPRTPHRGS